MRMATSRLTWRFDELSPESVWHSVHLAYHTWAVRNSTRTGGEIAWAPPLPRQNIMRKKGVSPTSHLLIPFLFQMPGSNGLSYVLDTWVGLFCWRGLKDGDGWGKLLDRPTELPAFLSKMYLCCRRDCTIAESRKLHMSYRFVHCL